MLRLRLAFSVILTLLAGLIVINGVISVTDVSFARQSIRYYPPAWQFEYLEGFGNPSSVFRLGSDRGQIVLQGFWPRFDPTPEQIGRPERNYYVFHRTGGLAYGYGRRQPLSPGIRWHFNSWKGNPWLNRLGFAWKYDYCTVFHPEPQPWTDFMVAAPHWAVSLALLLLAGLAVRPQLVAWVRGRYRQRRNLCPACGYDLRGRPETSPQCPECGTAIVCIL